VTVLTGSFGVLSLGVMHLSPRSRGDDLLRFSAGSCSRTDEPVVRLLFVTATIYVEEPTLNVSAGVVARSSR